MPYKHNESRRHKIEKARYKVTNWLEYNKALRQRGDITIWFTEEALAAWHPTKTRCPWQAAGIFRSLDRNRFVHPPGLSSVSGVFSTLRKKHQERRSPRTAHRR